MAESSDDKRPHVIYVVDEPDGPEGESYWHKIGAAWLNRDGSLSGRLVAFPVNGRFVIRKPKPKGEGSQGDDDGGERFFRPRGGRRDRA